jgi:carbon-monoxide dehydrogenase medium subunit
VRFPLWPENHGHAFVEFARRHGDFAIVSAAVLLTEDAAGKIARASVTLGGMGVAPARATELEQALIGHAADDDKWLREACESCRKIDAMEDIHAPASYRQHLATVMARRAIEQARARLPSRSTAAKTH